MACFACRIIFAMLLYQAGPAVDKIFQTLENTGPEDDYDTAVTRLTDYFEPQKNVLHATYMFRQCKQSSQESLAEYHVRLRTLAEKCDFGGRVDFEIKLEIVTNGTSTNVRKKALRDPDFILKQMLEEDQRVEASTQQTTEIENTLCAAADSVNLVKKKNQPAQKKCRNCGGAYPHHSSCPAQGKKCYKCGKSNHFAKFCMSNSSHESDKPSQTVKFRPKQVRQVTKEESSSDSEDNVYVYPVSSQPKKKQQYG